MTDRERILAYVADHPLCCLDEVVEAVALSRANVRIELAALGVEQRVAPVPRADVSPEDALYAAYRMGECEVCGTLDHYILLGECAGCRARSRWVLAQHAAQKVVAS